MSVDNDTLTGADRPPAPLVFTPREPRRRLGRRRNRAQRPRVKKFRLLLVVVSFLGLAVISLLFGVLTSIASDLPQFKSTVQFRSNVDSYLYDTTGKPIGVLAPPTKTAIDKWGDISRNMVNAIVSVEDKRFWHEPGVDIKGLIRAAASDVSGGQHEGGSTIPEEFIKNVREEEGHRTVLEKLIEAGMAFQLSHQWKHARIITQYLNTIYFGNGAIGVESAARVYFGWNHGYSASDPAGEPSTGCGDPDVEDPTRKECASVLRPWEAALLAGMVANPTEYNPLGTSTEQAAAMTRRNTVLLDMYQQHYIGRAMYETSINKPLPTKTEVQQPEEPMAAPYFTSWVRPQIVAALQKEGMSLKQAEYEADYGGLKINLSINLQMQEEAQNVINSELPAGENDPTASLVAIDNKTGEVRAMVSGSGDYQQSPFNLATLGYRQPGSSFKLFTLAAALSSGKYSPYSDFDSKQITIPFVKTSKNPYKGNAFQADNGTGHFPVHNFGNVYGGITDLTTATATSDNSVFAQLGLSPGVGTARVKHYAQLMGIRSPISTNPSMILGGLNTGVSALDMAHAYETVATGGDKIYNPVLGDVKQGPIGIDSITNCGECKQHDITNKHPDEQRVLSPEVASEIDELLHGPVDHSYGTGTAAAIPGVDVAGKTGTTSNYVDAWFVGWTPTMTVAVWVGYPDSGKSMATSFNGQPVEGGTYPAIIFHNFMVQAIQTMDDEAAHKTTTVTTPLTTGVTPATTPDSTVDTSSQAQTTTASTLTTPASTQTTPANTQENLTPTTPTTPATSTPTTPATTQAPSTPTTAVTTPPASSVTPSPQTTPPPPAPSGGATVGANGGSGL
jgi:penicillin-binding protein 1A